MSNSAAQARNVAIEAQPLVKVSKNTGFFSGIASSYADIWRHRDLLGQLTRREIRAKYKASVLGIVWSLIRPLTQLLIYYFAMFAIPTSYFTKRRVLDYGRLAGSLCMCTQ